jgi:hypothetical protein
MMPTSWVQTVADLQRSGPCVGVGVAVSDPPTRQLHAGVVFRGVKSGPEVLHLNFHAWLEQNPLPHPVLDFLWVKVPVDEDRIDGAIAACKRIFARSGGTSPSDPIPYGIRLDSGWDDQGRFRLGTNACGLTCATFALTVLEAQLGYAILDRDTWPLNRPEDAAWHARIIQTMRRYQLTHPERMLTNEHITRVEQERGAARFRPEEVAGAAHAFTVDAAASFAKASECASVVLARLWGTTTSSEPSPVKGSDPASPKSSSSEPPPAAG